MFRAALVYVVFYTSIASTAPYLAPYYRSLGLGLAEIGALASLSAAVQFLAGPGWGAVHDRFPASRILITIAALIAAAGALVWGLAGASAFLVVAVLMYAIGYAGTSPMLDMRALDIVGADRSRYALLRMWGSVSFFVAAPIIGLLVGARGPSGFILVYIPALLLTALLVFWLPARRSTIASTNLLRAPRRVLANRTLALYLIGALFAWTAVSGSMAFMTVYLQQLNAPPAEIGMMMSIGAMCEVPTMLFFPKLAARFGLEKLIVLGAAVVVVRMLVAALLTDPTLIIAFTAVHGVGFALLLIGGVSFVSVHAPKGAAASAQGVLVAVSSGLAAIVGSGAGGVIANFVGLRGFFATCVVLDVIGIALIAVAVLPIARREKPLAHAREVAGIAPIEPAER